ncbi:hypothetical protein BCF11_1005 [Collimonas sp. PA-H2]|uniref:hypothetical protein n=1 Tax=Collimonas sp. PA-H2 TaxID=1881062 RepID=UPI000BF8F294|nr:hypothetical protein [Collimonas sp. PA-H2]PFH08638.1 hypothetical protein BCF11_1005 [Collimonas sp. PA-H2]
MGILVDGDFSPRYRPVILPAAAPASPPTQLPTTSDNPPSTVTIGQNGDNNLFAIFVNHRNQLLTLDEQTKLTYDQQFLLVFKRLGEFNKGQNFDMRLVDSRLPGPPNPNAPARDPNKLDLGDTINLAAASVSTPAVPSAPVIPPLTPAQTADVNAVTPPVPPTLPTLADINSHKIDGQTLPEAAMTALVTQYSNADHNSDQYKWAMAVRAQSMAQTGVPVDQKAYKTDAMPGFTVTNGIIDLPKVQASLLAYSKNTAFTDQMGKDYQAITDGLTVKYFPTPISTTQKPLLWAAVNGDPVPKAPAIIPVPAQTGPVPTPSGSSPAAPAPTASPTTPAPVTLTPVSPDTQNRGNIDLKSLTISGLINGMINPQALAAAPQKYLSGGLFNPGLLQGVPAAKAIIDQPDLANVSLDVVANIQTTANAHAMAISLSVKPYGVNAQLAYLAKTHPELTAQQRSDAVNQAFELMGISNRQAIEYAKAVAPYLTAPASPAVSNGLPTATPGPAPVVPGTLPQGVALSADAPASAKAAWDALHKVAEMRAALDDTSGAQPTDLALTKNLDRASLETAINQGASTQFNSTNVAQGWSDYITSPAYTKWLMTLPDDQQKQQINDALATIRTFNPKIADTAAEKLGLNLYHETYDVKLGTVDPKAGAAAAYFVLNMSRWTARLGGFLAGTSDSDMKQFAKYMFTMMQRIQARGADPSSYTEFLDEARKDGSAPTKLLPLAETLNKAGAWGSIAGAIDVLSGIKRLGDTDFQTKLLNGDPDATVACINYIDIFGSYAEHYVRLGMILASPETKNKIALYQTYGEILPELKENLRPDVKTLTAALDKVDPTDKDAVKAALDNVLSKNGQLQKYFPGIKYDTKSFAERYSTAAKKLSADELAAVQNKYTARLGFLLDSPATGAAGGAQTPLTQEISKQAKALTGVNLSDQAAVKAALINNGKYSVSEADLLSDRIAATVTKGGARTETTLETYGRLTINTYSSAPVYSDPAIQKAAVQASEAGGNVALTGTIDVTTEKVASGLTRGLGYTGLVLKAGVAGLDILSGPLSIYSGVRDIYRGFNEKDAYGNSLGNNYGVVGFGAVETAGGAFWGAAGFVEAATFVDMASGPFFLVALGLTAVGAAGVYVSEKIFEPSKSDQNKQAMEEFFKPYNEIGLTSPDWKNNADNWVMTEQKGYAIIAPGLHPSNSLYGVA